MLIAYAKGARTFERHVDIDEDGIPVSPVRSLPHQIDHGLRLIIKPWRCVEHQGYRKEMYRRRKQGILMHSSEAFMPKRRLPEGHSLSEKDVYLAIPLQKGQICCREFIKGVVLLKSCQKDEPIMIDIISSSYAKNEDLKRLIYNRGI